MTPKRGDTVRMKGERHPSEEDKGTFLNVSLGQARVRWNVANATYWEDLEDLEVLPLEDLPQ